MSEAEVEISREIGAFGADRMYIDVQLTDRAFHNVQHYPALLFTY